MINNRQAGRRRGRGGQRQQGGNPNGQGNGNRIDNRARGNANQLYEKYKTLARDAQMQGDRVNTEYYLQFADHYFRVLSESRSRFEDQQPRRASNDSFDDEDGFYDGDSEEAGEQQQGQPQQQPRYEQSRHDQQRGEQPRRDREQREARPPREDREPRQPMLNGHDARADEPAAVAHPEEQRPRRGRPRRDRADVPEAAAPEQATFDAALLPPPITPVSGIEGEVDEAVPSEAKPRRRRRLSTATGEEVVAS